MYFKYCFILLFIGLQGLAQQPTKDQVQFSFDQLIKVNRTRIDSSGEIFNYKTNFFYLLRNSKNNSFYATIKNLDSAQYELKFFVFDSIATKVGVKASDFQKAKYINVDCKSFFSYENHFKYRKREYKFVLLNDTIINNKIYGKFVIKNNKPKREKRKKIWRHYFIIDKSKPALPFLENNLAYEVYKKKPNLPSGILVQETYVNPDGIVIIKDLFSEPMHMNKIIIIDKNCRYLSDLESK